MPEVIYIMKQQGSKSVYKIGKSADADKRLEKIKTGSPVPIELVKTFEVKDKLSGDVETYVHASLECYRVRLGGGSEFFDFGVDVSQDLVVSMVEDLVNDTKDMQREVSQLAEFEVGDDWDNDTKDGSSEAFRSNVTNLRRIKAKIQAAQMQVKQYESAIKSEMCRKRSARVLVDPGDEVSWTRSKQNRFDATAFKKDMPELSAKYTKETVVQTLRVGK